MVEVAGAEVEAQVRAVRRRQILQLRGSKAKAKARGRARAKGQLSGTDFPRKISEGLRPRRRLLRRHLRLHPLRHAL